MSTGRPPAKPAHHRSPTLAYAGLLYPGWAAARLAQFWPGCCAGRFSTTTPATPLPSPSSLGLASFTSVKRPRPFNLPISDLFEFSTLLTSRSSFFVESFSLSFNPCVAAQEPLDTPGPASAAYQSPTGRRPKPKISRYRYQIAISTVIIRTPAFQQPDRSLTSVAYDFVALPLTSLPPLPQARPTWQICSLPLPSGIPHQPTSPATAFLNMTAHSR